MTFTPIPSILPAIPDLPDNLQRVPSWLDLDEDPEAWRTRWPQWSENLKDFRVWVTKKSATDRSFRQIQYAAAANDVAYFLAVFGWIFEPRDTELGPPDWYPWALFPHQVIALRQLQEAWVSPKPRSDIVWEKSRDMGATWLAMGFCLHQWLFAKAFTAGLASYREDAVDDGTPDSMFFKIRGLLGELDYGESPGLPRWMRPEGYIREINGRRLKMTHPAKMCVVRGESTTMRSGTGGRSTLRVNDEGAKHEMLAETLASIRAVSNHILSLSSAYRGYGQDFQRLAERAKVAEDTATPDQPIADQGPRYFRMDYWMHPFHTEEWREREEAAYESPEAFAREVLIDYRAGHTNWVYGDEAAKVPLVEAGDDPANDLIIAIDPGYQDDTAIVFANVWGDPFRPKVRWVDVYENDRKPTEFYAHILSGVPPFAGDERYPRDVCYGLYDFGPEEERIMAWMRQVWFSRRPLRAVMDPAGAQKTMGSMKGDLTQGQSFHETLYLTILDLRERYVAQLRAHNPENVEIPPVTRVDIYYRHLYNMSRFDPRHTNLRKVLADSEVSNTRGGQRILRCWAEHRFQERTREATSDPKPVHDEYAHVVAASEYLACDIVSLGTISGRPATNRKPAGRRQPVPQRRKAA